MQEINFNQLKRLWNLKLVVDAGSIKRAAVRANVTSSALSQSISGLEEKLGRKLLLRNKEQVLPTEFGLKLLRSADSTFKTCHDFQKSLAGVPQVCPAIDWLDFAASDSLAVDVLPTIMQRLRLQLPHIRLKVKSGRSAMLTKLVKKAELCMALVEENEFIDGVTAIPLTEERLGFYASTKDSVQKLRGRAIETLGIGITAPGLEGHPRYFTKFVNAYAKGLKPTLTSESFEILRAAAVEGSVVAILPSRVANRRKGELMEIFPEGISEKKQTLGRYKIYLVSEPGCTTEENEFLAQELSSLLSGTI
jgi:DNA-binding transcriptional LysR family regulator